MLDAQNELREKELREHGSILTLTLETLETLYHDYTDSLSWSRDPKDELSILNLVEQVLSALSDYVQGPVMENQTVLARAGIFRWCGIWTELLKSASDDLKKNSEEWPGTSFSQLAVLVVITGNRYLVFKITLERN